MGRKKIRAYLQLMRLPNTFTAMADIMAGGLIVSGLDLDITALAALLPASAAIYGAGCVLNDICDREEDSATRPHRPLPAGLVSLTEAKVFCVALFGLGAAAAALAGPASLVAAGGLILLVIAYDTLTKTLPFWGPLTMGGCRAVNLLLGMSWGLSLSISLVFPLLSLVYVFFLTRLATFETGREQGEERWLILLGMHLVPAFFLLLTVAGLVKADCLLYLLAAFLLAGPSLWRNALLPESSGVGPLVKRLILAIPLLDAAYVAASHNVLLGLPVVFFLLPAFILAKIFYVT